MPETTVILKWERLPNWQEYRQKDGDEDYGIYQIVGYHTVFRDNSLLYIGMARQQTFAVRIGQHYDWLINEYGVTIYLGRVDRILNENGEGQHMNRWKSVISPTEDLLIYYHSPPYNSKSISEAPETEEKIKIINIGDYGCLVPELSHKGLELENPPPRPSDDDE